MLPNWLMLDEERKKRDALFQEKLGNVGSSLVQAPLTYDKLVKDAEDRKLKLEANRQKLMQDKEMHGANLEAKKASTNYMGAQATNLDIDNKRLADKAKQDKLNNSIESVVLAGLKDNLDDQAILQRAFDHPDLADVTDQSYVEAIIKKKRDEAEKAKFDQRMKEGNLAVKQQDADTRAARVARLNRAVAKNKAYLKALPVSFQRMLEPIRQDLNTAYEIQNKKRAVDTGIKQSLVAKVREMAKMPDAERAVFDQEIQALFNQIVKNQSGATVTAQEMARQLAAFPDRWTDDDVFDAMMDSFIQRVEDKQDVVIDQWGADPAYTDQVGVFRDNLPNTPAKERGKGGGNKPNTASKDKKPQQGESPKAFRDRMLSMGVSEAEAKQLWLNRMK